MKLLSPINQTNNKYLNLFVGICLIVTFIIRFCRTCEYYYTTTNLFDTFEYSEFLINFQGGFVRRGLLGEILYQVYSLFSNPAISIISLISIICFTAFFLVLIFFLYKFYKHKYCWWILFSPLFLGFTYYIVRKDYILYCVLIGTLYLLRNVRPSTTIRLFAGMLITLGLFFHEAFIFWGFPIYALLLLSKPHHKLLRWALIIIPLLVVILFSFFKGSPEVSNQIVESWSSIIQGNALKNIDDNSIGALSWDTLNTFLFHLKKNVNSAQGGYGIVVLPLFLLAGYYMFSNFLFVFSKRSESDKNGKFAISLVYSLLIICMIPMFTILSCDTGRNFQYISVATFATFLIIPNNDIIKAFPNWYKVLIQKFNGRIDSILPPNKGLLIIMLLFIGISPDFFSFLSCWDYSIVGTITNLIIKFIAHLFVCFNQWFC